jgi:hypothetical protein
MTNPNPSRLGACKFSCAMTSDARGIAKDVIGPNQECSSRVQLLNRSASTIISSRSRLVNCRGCRMGRSQVFAPVVQKTNGVGDGVVQLHGPELPALVRV